MKRLMKRLSALTVAGALLGTGLVAAAVAPASATVSYTGEVCVPSDERTETIEHPAVGEPTLVVGNPDYVPAKPSVPAVPAVGEPTLTIDNPDYVPAVPGTPGVPAVGEPTVEVENPDYVPGTDEIPGVPAQGEPTINVPNPAYVPAVPAIPAKPAVGEPTIVIPNPDYVAPTYTPGYNKEIPASYTPAVGAPTITVEQENPDYVPATEEQVVADGFIKWNWTAPQKDKKSPTSPPPGEGWHEVGHTNDSKGNTPDTIIHQGHGHGSYFYFQSVTKTIPGTPAQGEPTIWVTIPNPDHVPASYIPAHTVWVPPVYTPPVGKPTITVDNPDYEPGTPEIPGTPAVGEPTIEIENPDYVPAVPGTPAVPAVGTPTIVVPNPAYIPEKPGTPGTPAIGEPTIVVPNPDYVAEIPEVPGTPAQGEPTITVVNPDYIPERTETITHPAVVCPPPVEPEEPEDLLNCSDFEYQEDAQAQLESDLAEHGKDVNGLDQNNDGIACETLPNKPEEPTTPVEPEKPVVTPEEPVEPAPVAPAPLKAAAAAPVEVAESDDTLAVTGADTASLWSASGLGLLLLLAGGVLALARRKRVTE